MTDDRNAIHDRLATLLGRTKRIVLGLVGAPGSGKSTLAADLAGHYGERAVVIPMDGFHLAECELRRLGRAGRKGAPDTFDASGFIALLARVRHQKDDIVYAPVFRREIEEPIANAIPVLLHHELVIVEGNYLLFDGPWQGVRPLLDESWFLATDETRRDAWLMERHMRFGRSREAAREWIDRTDAPNAARILATRDRADWICPVYEAQPFPDC
ncbi:nucleoside/nucleotide kinase family protein [Swaminathania salitolerans]|uniref:Nucleoside/nucleotide kinase family protein n=1 Tax=Swaminathania salitolerans TaxID=182838 RepID=A0A511BN24_9PROT|nr:nucleoside/nucleotide kinase family protein [Swaminathania salitolerans]GBQ16269.1 panthothenate kinase [Swaminathania salitolerans LMG 21291]GEL01655.1 nucleoside/nucleotide kinase family protein [Swaminathania salitolerans]